MLSVYIPKVILTSIRHHQPREHDSIMANSEKDDDSSQESSSSESESSEESNSEESSSEESSSEESSSEESSDAPSSSEPDSCEDSSHTEVEDEIQPQLTTKRAATPFYETPHNKRARHQTPVPPPKNCPISTMKPAYRVTPRAACKTETPVPPPQGRGTPLVKLMSAATPLSKSKAPTLIPPPTQGSITSPVEPMSAVTPLPKPKALVAATVPQKRHSSTSQASPTRIRTTRVTPADTPMSETKKLASNTSLPTKVGEQSPILSPTKNSAAPPQKPVPRTTLSTTHKENSPILPPTQQKISMPNKVQSTSVPMAELIAPRRVRSPRRPPLKPLTSSAQNIRQSVEAAFAKPTEATAATKSRPKKAKTNTQVSPAVTSVATKPRVEAPRRHHPSSASRSAVQNKEQSARAALAQPPEAVSPAKKPKLTTSKRSKTTVPRLSSQQTKEEYLSLAGNVSQKSDPAAGALSAKPELQVPSTQDFVKKKLLQSQQPQAIRQEQRTSVTDKSTPSLTPPEFSSPRSSPSPSPSLIPRTPSPAPSAPSLLDSRLKTPVDERARTATLTPKEVERSLEWSEQPPVVLGRDSRVPQIMPKVVRGVTVAGQIPNPISEQMDQALKDSNLSLIITVTNDPDNHHLLQFMQACLPQTPYFCGALIRNKHVIASYAKPEWRAFAMRTFNGSVMVEGAPCVQVNVSSWFHFSPHYEP